RGYPGESIRVVRAPRRKRVVEHPVPGDTRLGGKTIAKYVGPGADDLSLDALCVEPSASCGGRLDEPGEERPHLEAVIEMQRRRGPGGMRQPYPDLLAARLDCLDQLRRDVMGMNVDRHAVLQILLGEVAGRMPQLARG